ncbi:unnamed protein product [Moneuplotes crassus]|uniref:BZIP domain-containing protein n=1 Tax=Euplotes crassus TaxID=5936 RepID=A0AAD1XJ66_EUPCR|nr:unnamed protein product [Moneuplotes crassus]
MDIFFDPSISVFGPDPLEPLSKMFDDASSLNITPQSPQNEELKKDSLSSETDQQKNKIDTSIEERRRRGKIRSKKCRDKKKIYIQGLEEKIKELQKENFRLQNLVANYRNEKLEYFGKEIKTFEKDSRKHKIDTFQKFIDPETFEMKKDVKENLGDIFNKTSKLQMERHKRFMDEVFKIVVNHACPFDKFFKKCPTKEYTTKYETIKALDKLFGDEREEFIKENNLLELDLLMADFRPSKRQFLFMKDILLKKQYLIVEKYREGISLLLQAKDIFQKTSVEVWGVIHFMFNSKIFSDEQILKGPTKRDFFTLANSFEEFWNIETHPVEYDHNIFTDPILGKKARRNLSASKTPDSFSYNQYILPA